VAAAAQQSGAADVDGAPAAAVLLLRGFWGKEKQKGERVRGCGATVPR
jgi:hypothetical protein